MKTRVTSETKIIEHPVAQLTKTEFNALVKYMPSYQSGKPTHIGLMDHTGTIHYIPVELVDD
jgi:hypothetical protein